MAETPKAPKLYFPGLNGLRFIAAFAVFVGHVELIIRFAGGPENTNHWARELGLAGVGLFFVISGYLITYLLMMERDSYKEIKLGDFYVRRILRIWPLYYWVLLVTLVIIPLLVTDRAFGIDGVSRPGSFLLFIFFMPFASMCIFPTNFLANILWSVGVEEMYYLFWPLIIRTAPRITFGLFISLLLGFLSVKAVLTYLPYKVHTGQDILKVASGIISLLRFDMMLIGGAMAYIAMYRPDVMRFFRNKTAFIISLVLITYFLVFGFTRFYFGLNPIVKYMTDPVIFGLCCAIVVLNITHDTSLSGILERKFFFVMGQISFGFYVYHSIALFLLVRLLVHGCGMDVSGIALHAALFAGGFALTTAMAYISYHYFEVRFLRLKKRFTLIVSGNEARQGGNPDIVS